MKYLLWLLKAAIFFTLFAFALNNQQEAAVHFFFGTHWMAPQVLIVLAAFCAGLMVGVLVMVPRWWMHRQAAHKLQQSSEAPANATPTETALASSSDTLPPTIHGL